VLKNEIKKHDIEELVDFIGWVKENEIPNYLSISKLGLSPLHRNIHHDTTYANKIFQYISFGCPIVSSNVTAQSELIKKYNIGVVFEDRNVMDLTKKIIQLYNEKDLFEKYRANCNKSIKKLNNSVISNQLISIYE
jgi:glycosyltransferase involved in cell wall biosynthesis